MTYKKILFYLYRFVHILATLKRKILDFWNRYVMGYGKSLKEGYVHNAFSPLVWFVFFLVIPLLIGLFWVDDIVFKYILIILIAILIIFTLIMYVVLLCKDPKLLQSEHYHLENKKLDLMAQQGTNPNDLLVTNPESVGITEIQGGGNE